MEKDSATCHFSFLLISKGGGSTELSSDFLVHAMVLQA